MVSLKSEFPECIELNQSLPNHVRFLQRAHREHREEHEDEEDDAEGSCNFEDKGHDVVAPPLESAEKREKCAETPEGRRPKSQVGVEFKCDLCDQTYRRKHDLVHHRTVVHSIGQLERHPCRTCGRLFMRLKDCRVHERGNKCYSRRGRWAITLGSSRDVRSEQIV